MKSKTRLVLLAALHLAGLAATAAPLGAAFTYQGQLQQSGQPVGGLWDFRFSLWDASNNPPGRLVGETQTVAAVTVASGLFAVGLDFGAGAFPGEARWLEIAVRTNGAAGDFTLLTPRQPIAAVPYALTAANLSGALAASGLSGAYTNAVNLENPANQFIGGYRGNGGGLSNVNSFTLSGLGAGAFWQTGGNAGTAVGTNFLGTVDNQPLELKVNSLPALRLEPALKSPNSVGGYEGNSVAPGVSGATIAGGGTRRDSPGENGGPERNWISANYGFIGAGFGNEVGGSASVIAGGTWNSLGVDGWDSFIGSGNGNDVESPWSTIPGGSGNSIGVLSGGGFIGGGLNNQIGNGVDCATIGGGSANKNDGKNAFLGGGTGNLIQPGYADDSSCALGGGMSNVIGGSSYSVLAGGRWNFIWSGSEDVTLSGGRSNVVQEHAYGAAIAGGVANTVNGDGSHASIGGGSGNLALGSEATIGGGRGNSSSTAATVAGGANNASIGYEAAIGGGYGNVSSGDNATVAGGRLNRSEGEGATVGDGANNLNGSNYGTISGGLNNSNGAFAATVAGGIENLSGGSYAVVSGGGYNCAKGFAATVAGGGGFLDEAVGNSAAGDWSTVSGGRANGALKGFAVVAGGEGNYADGQYAVVPGGLGNLALGDYSFAAGENAIAEHDGAFVWADGSLSAVLRSTTTNQFTARAAGGVRFFTDAHSTTGAELASGSGSWSSLSDRAAKEEIRPVDAQAVLEQLARLPLGTWRYKTQAPDVRHLGPMAQDFHAAFGVGEDDRHISSVDADGVSLAAIQGLNRKLEEAVKERDDRIAALEQRLAALEQRLGTHPAHP
jgi:trimeric autotransporter adhesin